ncbi:sulfite exporter TauE/SafE family protein, partial [candidate division WWE3 bacterium]|nr:sulfite exporter TauE/SafE family protein [candidate division WWE3 bacterium]
MLNVLILSFLAGVITVLTPCVLPFLPVILSTSAQTKNFRKALAVVLSLSFSVFIFTLILKASTIFISIPQSFWTTLSGVIVLLFGIVTVFPSIWDQISVKTGMSTKSDEMLNESSQKEGLGGEIAVGLALGPVFSSCSPTYFLILSTILPASFAQGIVYLIAYVAGLGGFLLLIALFGQRLTSRLKSLADPRGLFKRALGVILVIVGLLIITGLDKDIEAAILDLPIYRSLVTLEQGIADKAVSDTMNEDAMPKTDVDMKSDQMDDAEKLLNVNPPIKAP